MELLRGHSAVGARPGRCLPVQHTTSLVIRPRAAVKRRQRLTAAAEVDTAATAADATSPAAAAAAAAAAVEAPPPAAPEAPAPPAAAAALEASAPAAAPAAQGGASSSARDDSATAVTVRVGADTTPAKVAGYLLSLFQERGDDFTVILTAVGATACGQALKAVARLQARLAEDRAADHCVVFRTQSNQRRAQPPKQQQQGQGQAGEEDGQAVLRAQQLAVRLGTRSSWPQVAFNPAGPPGSEDSDKDSSSSRDSSRDRDRDSSSRDGSGKEAAPVRTIPMLVKVDAQDERVRLQTHALRAARRSLPAQFLVVGGKSRTASGVLLLLQALAAARKQALSSEEPFDLQCTVTSSSYTVQRDAPSRDGNEQQADSPAEGGAAAADAEAGASSSAAAAAGGSSTLIRNRYVVTVMPCEPSKKALAAAERSKRRAEAAAARGRGGRGAGAPRPTRPGFVEVREEEWNQLKEQLQVVPHLTEQLQIMTRQHEQLLTLLAAQQGQQQQDQE